jgi:hypothetical protein
MKFEPVEVRKSKASFEFRIASPKSLTSKSSRQLGNESFGSSSTSRAIEYSSGGVVDLIPSSFGDKSVERRCEKLNVRFSRLDDRLGRELTYSNLTQSKERKKPQRQYIDPTSSERKVRRFLRISVRASLMGSVRHCLRASVLPSYCSHSRFE